jgi:diadenosine tetraphosphatase ApaH/serine/threonine PP2A family protein phosphatase
VPGDMLAIISDIHGNLEALTRVLAEIDSRPGVTEIICLGDIIGYGPNPTECLDLVIDRCSNALLGNHDFAVFYEPFSFNRAAESASYWTRAQFEAEPDIQKRNRRWRYLSNLQFVHTRPGIKAAHASPRRPINEYIFPDDIYTNAPKFTSLFEVVEKLCFVGHTHVPGAFLEGPDFYSPVELDGKLELGREKAIVNVGSVGQPRDHDPRASFVLTDGDTVEFMRVEYDVSITIDKMNKVGILDPFLSSRLRDGK